MSGFPCREQLMTEMIIQTSGLTRRYKTLLAVDGMDLQVPQGGVYGFLGPNGAGKTTTIRMLLGLIKPSAGQATSDDRGNQMMRKFMTAP